MTSPEPDSTAPLTLSPLRRALPVAEDSQSKDVMLKSNHRIRPTLFDLPPELKAIIVEMIYEGTDDDDFADQETVASDGEDDKEDDNAEDQDKDEVKASTLQNMSLVDSTFSQLCFPLLWKHVDFEGKDNIRVACFLDEILPRHGTHVTSIWFRSTREENALFDDDYEDSEDSHVFWDERDRIMLFVQVIRGLTNLDKVDMDVAVTHPDEFGSLTLSLLGRTLVDLSLSAPGVERIGSTKLSELLFALPSLRRLELDGADEDQEDGRLVKSIVSLNYLEILYLSDAQFVSKDFANAPFTANVKILALDDCDHLTFPDFITLVEKFSASLEVLDLDNVPSTFDEANHVKCLKHVYELPALTSLIVSTYHPISFLNGFKNCRLTCLEFGYNPLISCDEIETFLNHLWNRPVGQKRLERFVILGNSHLSDGAKESLELWAYAKGIECIVEAPDSDDEDDDSDEEGDDTDPYGYDDEDDNEDESEEEDSE